MNTKEAKALALVALGRIEAKNAVDKMDQDDARQTWLTDAETEALIVSYLETVPQATGAELTEMVNEVISLRVMNTCVDLAIKGIASIRFDATLPVGERLSFKSKRNLDAALQEAFRERR